MQVIKSFLKESWERRIVRFLCIGSFNTLLDFTILNLLIELGGLHELVANTISVSIGITISYLLNHRVVFRQTQKVSLTSFARFFLVTGMGVIFIQNVVIYVASKTGLANSDNNVHLLLHDVSDKTLALNIAKALAVIVGMIWNFLLYKYVVFAGSAQSDKTDKVIIV